MRLAQVKHANVNHDLADSYIQPAGIPHLYGTLQVLNTNAGTAASLVKSDENVKDKDEVLRNAINAKNKQTIPFSLRYRFFIRGIIMFFVLAGYYYWLVPHIFFQYR